MRVNRLRDFVERVGWTAIEAASGAALTVLTGATLGWRAALTMIGTTTAVAVLKVIIAQRAGDTNEGAAIPGGIKETP
jgi:hypothetical protein